MTKFGLWWPVVTSILTWSKKTELISCRHSFRAIVRFSAFFWPSCPSQFWVWGGVQIDPIRAEGARRPARAPVNTQSPVAGWEGTAIYGNFQKRILILLTVQRTASEVTWQPGTQESSVVGPKSSELELFLHKLSSTCRQQRRVALTSYFLTSEPSINITVHLHCTTPRVARSSRVPFLYSFPF